ncbi:hypothetical protein KC316_g9094 [Hortaea werneckii]|nr:hypothetical protein KC324_g2843 [Hortaea werneckii]KAI7580184.1 hypothetical protein KC316_g9094 [Hortaea werneckii]
MPTHEEHLAGIEEATGRVRTLRARFNSVEDDWCEAGKQLQSLRELRQRWIDEYGYTPSDPLMWTLLQPSQKLYTRKAREYLAVSRELTARREMSLGRVRNANGRRTESACGSNGLPELKPSTVKGEKKKHSVRDKKKKRKLSVKNDLEPKPGHARDEKKSSGKKELVKSRPGVKHKPDKKNRPEESASKPNRTHESDSASKPSRKPESAKNPSLTPTPQSTTQPPLQNPTETSTSPKQPSNGEPAS